MAITRVHWFKGNLHTHTTNSDGDTAPEHVADWYHRHGYDFLVLSDHNHLTILDAGAAGRAKWPLLVRGEEVTMSLDSVPVHLNGIGITRLVEPEVGGSIVETMQLAVDHIRAAGGLAQVNHPNYKWALTADHIAAVEGLSFLEVFNGHPVSNSLGGGGKPGAPAVWDRLLSAGRRIWGVATDDSHHFQEEFSQARSNPGRGWVVVRSSDLSEESLVSAMGQGHFYASTGVTLAELHHKNGELVLEIEPDGDARFTTTFTTDRGYEVWRTDGLSARYRMSRLDSYVRATVYSSRSTTAWTQPLFQDE